MKNARRLYVALGGAFLFGAAALLACGDDTELEPTAIDAGTGVDSAFEASANDSAVNVDAADASIDFDGGFAVGTFDAVVASEVCKSLARCCFGSETPPEGGIDGGSFDMEKCTSGSSEGGYLDFGFEGSGVKDGLIEAGRITLDQRSADDCVKRLKALKCDLPADDFKAIRAACVGAYRGKLTGGAPCNGTVECQNGLFCRGQLDGGPGTCAALEGLGGGCGQNPDVALGEYEETCSNRGSGDTGRYCRVYDFDGGGVLDAGEWKCAPASGVGANCAISTWCKDSVCSTVTSVCEAPIVFFKDACELFVDRNP